MEFSPLHEMTWVGKSSRTSAIDPVAVWAVAPSCWNHTAPKPYLSASFLNSASLVRKKSLNIAT